MRKMYSKEQIKALSIQSLKEAIESGEIEIPQPSILIVKGWMKDDEGDVYSFDDGYCIIWAYNKLNPFDGAVISAQNIVVCNHVDYALISMADDQTSATLLNIANGSIVHIDIAESNITFNDL